MTSSIRSITKIYIQSFELLLLQNQQTIIGYYLSINIFIMHDYSNTSTDYLKSITIPPDIKLPSILSSSNIIIKVGKNAEDTNQQSISINEEAMRKINGLFKQGGASQEMLQLFGLALAKQNKQFSKLFTSVPKIADTLSCAILKSLKLLHEKETKISESVYNSLIDGVLIHQKTLAGASTFKLFLALVYSKAESVLRKPLKQVIQYFPLLVQHISLIQIYVKNDKEQFKTIREIFRIANYIICWFSAKTIPKRLIDFIQNKQTQKVQRDVGVQQVDKNTLSRFYEIVIRYGLVDPEYRQNLLKVILQIFANSLQNQNTIELYKVCIILLNKRIFDQYEQKIFSNLDQILDNHVKLQNREIFIKIIKCLISEKEHNFFIQNKRYLLKFAISQEIEVELFSQYYSLLKNPKLIKYCDYDIFNKLIEWNIKYSVVPLHQFLENFLKISSLKINATNQKLIYGSDSKLWYPIIQKMAEQKIKQFIESRKSVSSSSTISFSAPLPIEAEDFNKASHIYIIYTQKLFFLITGMEYKKYAQKIEASERSGKNPISFITINENKQNMENVKSIREYSNIILERAIKNKIMDLKFLQIHLILRSLTEIIRVNELDNTYHTKYYIQCIRSIPCEGLMILMPHLLNTFKICKNAFTLYILLCLTVSFCTRPKDEKAEQRQIQLKKYIQEVVKLIKFGDFTKITSFSSQNIKLIIILSYLSPQLKKICMDFLICWAPLLTKSDIELLIYQFDSRLFSYYLQEFSINEKFSPESQVSTYIFQTLKLILNLLSSPSCSSSQYLTNTNNCIFFIPIRHEKNKKNSLHLQFKVLINPNLCCNSSIQFYGTPRFQSINATQKNRIIFQNKEIIFYNRNTKKIEASYNEPKNELYQRPFVIGIRISNSKFVMEVNKNEIICTDYNFLVDSIRFDLNGDILLKQLKWRIYEQQQHILEYNNSYQIFPSEVEIKVCKLNSFNLKNFQDKINFSYLCAYLEEIIRVNFSHIDLNKFYQYCSAIVLAKDGGQKNQFTSSQFFSMKKLFRSILLCSENVSKIEIPQILKQKQEENKKTNILKTKKFYQFLICSVINQKFLNQTTAEGKKNLLKYLLDLLFDQSVGFGFFIENRKTTIFATLTRFITRLDGQIRDQYSELLINILLNHEINEVLLKKISIIFSSTYTNKSDYLQKLLDNFFEKIVSVISLLPTEQNYHQKAIGKFILSQYKNLQYIFLMTSTDIKLKILDNMIDDEQLSSKCHGVFKNLPEEELLELSDRIIVYSKKAIFDFFDAKRQNQLNLSNMLFFLKELTQALPILIEQSHKQDTISILSNFMKKSNKLFTNKELQQKLNPTVIERLQSFYCYPNFVRLIGKKIQMYNAEDIKNESHQSFIFSYFNILFSVIPKLLILKALNEFQKSTENAFESCLYILSLDAIIMLPERALSAFLQYLLQMLIMVRSQKQQSRTKKLGNKIHECLQKITKNYAKVSHISRPLLYSYPKLQKVTQINNVDSVKKSIITAKEVELFELKGGIFFKLLCIVFHLFQIFPEQDLSYYIVFFLDKICHDKHKNNNEAVYRATNDFIQVNKEVKNRSPLDLMIKQIQKEHLKYFQNDDEQMIIVKSSPVRRTQSGKVIDVDLDLTPFFVDFFLMKLFIYLENHCTKYASQEQIKVLEKYSKETLYYLKSFQQIWDQMNEKNSQSIINYERVEDLYTLIDNQEDSQSDKINSPQVNHRLFPSYKSNRNITFEEMNNNFEIEGNFLGTPKKSSLRRRSSLTFDLTSGKKKKKEIISAVQNNIYAWSEEGKKKQMHKFFRDQPKEILFYELLHQLYTRFSVGSEKQTHLPKAKRIMGFVKDQEEKYYEEEQTGGIDKVQKIVIRKVYRFTSQLIPKMKLKRNQFPNFTYPFVDQIQHEIKASSSHITPELLQSLKSQQMSEPENNEENLVYLDNNQENSLDQQSICEISQPAGVYFCVWELTNKSIVFTSKSEKQAKGNYNKRIIKYGSPVCNIIKEEGKKIEIQIKDVHEIFFRKYNQVRDNSLQFFFKNGYSAYAVFYTKQRTQKFIQKCHKKFPEFHLIKVVDNHVKSFQSQNYTEKWVSGQISNFDYLMLVNKYAGRTFCDLNQYYIFPWILEDYTSKILDISNVKIYRDLKKPIGALRESKLQKYLEKISKIGQPNEQYLYGSHYSTSLFIYYYLVRLEPFTSLHKDMQSGQFDAADRLFSSIQQMWDCLMSQSSTSDIKEAIPQFYYFPTFLKNINSLNFGKKQSGQAVSHVQLPPWASSPADFILKMRACLESDYVSSNINYWIDLIFGKDQKSFQKNNVFHSLCYVENITPQAYPFSSLDATMSQITFFGQNPYALFTKQHPKKKVKANSISSSNLSLYTTLDLTSKQNLKSSINKIYEQEKLEDIYYVSEMFFKSKNIITIKITVISKEAETKVIQLNMEHTIHSLFRTIQKRQQPTTSIARRLLSQNNIEIPYEKISVNYEINEQEIKFSIGVREKSQIVHNIKLQYNFQYIRFNQTVLVLYGSCGLRVYDWNQDLIWKFSSELGQVSQCFLETGLMFFTTSTGKLFVYDFLAGYQQIIYEYARQTCEVKMLVYPQNKFITKKNEYTYKFLLVGDKRKILLLHYTHRVGKLSFKN